MTTRQERTILISGASIGIGRATAAHLAGKGYRVFGTGRNLDAIEPIPNVTILGLDVRQAGSVRQCVDEVLRQAGRIDVLVNNAGHALTGAAEEASDEEVRTQFETNYFGLVRLTNAVLPAMRERRSGHIVNVSSIVGFAAIPFMGHYSASKFAIEGYSEALCHELLPFGIHVSLVEPGAVRTQFFGSSGMTTSTRIADYGQWREAGLASMTKRVETNSLTAEKVATTIARAIECRKPAFRYPVGRDANITNPMKRFLPFGVFQRIWRREMGVSGAD